MSFLEAIKVLDPYGSKSLLKLVSFGAAAADIPNSYSRSTWPPYKVTESALSPLFSGCSSASSDFVLERDFRVSGISLEQLKTV